MIKVDAMLRTMGDGLWSTAAKSVKVVGIWMPYIDEEEGFGELKVYFDTATWDTEKDGLIYTDKTFMSGLKTNLIHWGLDGNDVCYSEQGMQGDDFVSCDVGEDFIASYKKMYPEQYAQAYADCNG